VPNRRVRIDGEARQRLVGIRALRSSKRMGHRQADVTNRVRHKRQ